MIDRSAMIDDRASNHGESPADGPHHAEEPLELRVHRLEDAVAALQDTQLMEERITERVAGRINRKSEALATGIVDANRLASAGPKAAPPSLAVPDMTRKSSWLLVECFRELRMMFRMFFDSRYRVSWSAFFALMLLAYILVSRWLWSFWGGVPILGLLTLPMHMIFIGEILDKAVDLMLALIAYKTLSREMRRYRETVPSP